MWLRSDPPIIVGHKEEPITPLGNSEHAWRKAVPLRIVPARGQVPENSVCPPNSDCCDVFHDDESWSYRANDSQHFRPQTRTLSVNSDFRTHLGNFHAWESACDNVNFVLLAWFKMSDVSNIRPKPFQYWFDKFSYFTDPTAPHSRRIEPCTKTTNPRKQFAV